MTALCWWMILHAVRLDSEDAQTSGGSSVREAVARRFPYIVGHHLHSLFIGYCICIASGHQVGATEVDLWIFHTCRSKSGEKVFLGVEGLGLMVRLLAF
jgi:RsiW-degrading membrane proteinase PrsW (M82 family)